MLSNIALKPFAFTLFGVFIILTCQGVDVRNIQNILGAKCVNCHRDNPRMPFDFVNANHFNANKKLIAEVVRTNYMPLWKPDANYTHFDNQTVLTEQEKNSILEWCASDVKLKKITPTTNSFRFTKPDFSVAMNDPFIVPATGKDVFATIKIPFEFKEEQFIRGIEFENTFPFLVHHASIFIVREAENLNVEKGKDRYIFPDQSKSIQENFNLYNEMNLAPYNKPFIWDYLVYKTHWQFGMSSYVLPENCGFVLPKKGAIVIDNIHYKGTMSELRDLIKINFIKQENNNPRQCISTSLGNGQLSYVEPPLEIQPHQIQTHFSVVTLPDDMSLMEVTPHMHQLGRKFISFAVTPHNDTIKIIKIDDWDADWQETYRFNPLLKIPKGSKIFIIGVFDNTANNPKNPNNPPILVGQSMNKHDEMLEMLLTFFPYQKSDETKKVSYSP